MAIQPAQAVVLFQDDTFEEVRSGTILIGSNDSGSANTAIQFGNDVSASENGNIQWNISTNTFHFDHSIDVTGGATVSGTTTLNGATNINGTAAIGDGGDDISINSNDWDISSAGVASGFTGLTSSGTVSSTGSLEVSGNANIGDGGDDVFINSNDWDISSTGVASGFTGMTSTGTVNYTGATYQGPQGAADPATCSIGNYFYNTASNLLKICTAVNTWSPLLRTDASQTFTSGTLTFNSGTTLTGNGTINFTSATSFRPPQGSADPGTCSVGQEFYNTTSNAMKVCTATNTWTIAVSPNGADFLDGVDSTQFLRSDASDNFTSGTLTTDNGTTLAVAGTANIGDGGDDIFINSNDWDVSSAGVASGFTGFTSSGTVNLSGTTSLRIREGADQATAACTTVKEVFLDTTENRAYVCTVIGSPGTWVGMGAGDAGTLDSIDSGSFLRSDTSDTFTSGTLTMDNGTTLAVAGTANIGDGGDDIFINSNDWDISSAGVGSGFTGFTSTGVISLGNNTGTIVFDGTNFDVTSAGAVTLTGNLNLSGDASEGISGGGLVSCNASNQSLQWNSTTNKFECTTAGNRTASFSDTSPANLADNNTTELFNDSPRPNITTSSTTSTVLVAVSVRGNLTDGDDQQSAVRVVRETNGTNPSCFSDPQVGDVFSGFGTQSGPWTATGLLLDSPGVAGEVRYTVCSSSLTVNSGDFDPGMIQIDVTLVELGN